MSRSITVLLVEPETPLKRPLLTVSQCCHARRSLDCINRLSACQGLLHGFLDLVLDLTGENTWSLHLRFPETPQESSELAHLLRVRRPFNTPLAISAAI